MKSKFVKKPGSIVELEVTLEQKEFQVYWQAAYDQAAASVQLKGFRPGTAPKELADQAIDKDKVFNEAANQAVRITLDELAKENQWVFVDQPRVEVVPADLDFKYKATLTIFPEVKLGDYKKIARRVFADKKEVVVEPAEIEKSLEWLRSARAPIVLVNRETRRSDLVDIDVTSAADNLKGEKFVLGQGRFLPGFESQLANHKAGDNLEFSLTAPADYWHEKLRGQKIDFKVRINQVYERQLPKLNDEFAKSLGGSRAVASLSPLGPNFKTLADLRQSVADGLKQEKETQERDHLRAKVMAEIVAAAKIDIPEIMVSKTLAKMAQDHKQILQKSGQSDAAIREQLRPRALNNVVGNLVIYKIAQMEKLEPTPPEIEQETAMLKSRAGAQVDTSQYYDYIYGVVQNRKVFEFLENLAN